MQTERKSQTYCPSPYDHIVEQIYSIVNDKPNDHVCSLLKSRIKKITKILNQDPEILQDYSRAEELLSLAKNLQTYISELPSKEELENYSLALRNVDRLGIYVLAHTPHSMSDACEMAGDVLVSEDIVAKTNYREQKIKQGVDEIFPHLQQSLIGYRESSQLREIAKYICGKIYEISLNYQKYQGKFFKDETYKNSCGIPFKLEEVYNSDISPIVGFYLWFKVSDDPLDKHIYLVIQPDLKPCANQGVNFEVFKAQGLKIPSYLSGEKQVNLLENLVLKKPRNRHVNQKILDQLKIQQFLLKLEKAKIAALPSSLDPKARKTSAPWIQEWCNHPLHRAANERKIPLNIEENKKKPFSCLNIFQVLIQVSRSLVDMHNKNFVHGDVKGDNILVKADKYHDKVEGFLSDLDFTGIVGKRQSLCQAYDFWDETLRRLGILTPFTDVYGLAITLGYSLFPNFKNIKADLLLRAWRLDDEAHKKLASDRYIDEILGQIAFKKLPKGLQKLEENRFKDILLHYENHINQMKSSNEKAFHIETYKQLLVLEKAYRLIEEVIIVNGKLYAFLFQQPNFFENFTEKLNANSDDIPKLMNKFYEIVPSSAMFKTNLKKIKKILIKQDLFASTASEKL